MKVISYFFMLSIIISIFISTASAADVVVDPGDSIQTAINGADPGDKIIVNPGTYNENIDVNRSVIIISQSGNPDDTIVQANDSDDHVFNVTSDDVIISGFNITGASSSEKAGIFLYEVQNNTLENNIVPHNDYGIFISSSNDNMLNNNNASNSNTGIFLLNSSDNNLNYNNADSNSRDGIWLLGSSNNTLNDNTANSNVLNGIHLEYSSDNKLDINTASNNFQGFVLFDSSNNDLNNNNASENDDVGFWLFNSDNNNNLNNNIALNNYDGVLLNGSSNNTLSSNVIRNNIAFGIRLFDSDNNIIYNNYFNNTNNTQIENISTGNVWNVGQTAGPNIIGGPYIGGNYWATPDGTGFSQTCVDTNDDGFCELKYDLDPNNTDLLPLTLRKASIDIEKFTNGEDADEPKGPWIQWNYRVFWTYNITNTGNLNLTNIMITDSDSQVNDIIECPGTELAPGESMVCTATGSARLYHYSNTGTVSAWYEGFEVNDTDPSHYYGYRPIPSFEIPTADPFLLVSMLGIAIVFFMRREKK